MYFLFFFCCLLVRMHPADYFQYVGYLIQKLQKIVMHLFPLQRYLP